MINQALSQLISWVEQEKYWGWDPHDALNSPILNFLTFNNRVLGQGWVQLVKRSPVNLRSILGIPKGFNPKGMGLFFSAYSKRYAVTKDTAFLHKANFFGEWLKTHTSPNQSGAAWGYNFDWPNRSFFARAGTPTVVNTGFIGLAFLDYANCCQSGSKDYRDALSIARSACGFIQNDLNSFCPFPDELCFSYTPLDHRYVHNASLLGAWLLAEAGVRIGETGLVDLAVKAGRFTARRQDENGSWAYGVEKKDGWVDNFHTGFVLIALRRIGRLSGTDEFTTTLQKGYQFWKRNFFLGDGTPKYYWNNTYPIDIHNIAQSVLTFLEYRDLDPQALAWAKRELEWGIRNMRSPKGYFYYQIYPHYVNRIPYMRWAQAWMLRAMVEYLNIAS